MKQISLEFKLEQSTFPVVQEFSSAPPPIPLSFNLAIVLPKRQTKRFHYGTAATRSRCNAKSASFTAQDYSGF